MATVGAAVVAAAAEIANFAAWRARTVLSITWQCSLYIPLTRLQDDMQAPFLSRIWQITPSKVILQGPEVSLPTDSKLQPMAGA